MNTWFPREDRKVLENRINDTIRKNSSYIIYSIIVMMIVSVLFTVALGIMTLPFVGIGEESGGISPVALIPSVIIGYLSLLITLVLCYGLSVILGRFYRQERAVIGHLFWGLRDMKRQALIPLLFYVLILGLSLVFSFAATPLLDSVDLVSIVMLILLPVMLIVLLLGFRYLYTFCLMYDNPAMPLLSVLKTSSRMLKKKKWKVFCFSLYMIRIPALVWFISLLLTVFTAGVSEFIAAAASTTARISVYFMLIYLLLAWNALYYYETDPESLASTVALPDAVPVDAAESVQPAAGDTEE